MKIIERLKLGSFAVGSDAIKASDPCYDDDTWCAGYFDALNGEWEAVAVISDERDWGHRVAELVVHHVDHTDASEFEKCEFEAGVDSGQFGFYDLNRWRTEGAGRGEFGEKGSFYGDVCELTLDEKKKGIPGGVINGFGAVTRSGYGDGGYSVYVVRGEDGKAVAAKVVFISDEDEDEVE